MKTVLFSLQMLSVIAAVIAAGFWWWSATVRTPASFNITVLLLKTPGMPLPIEVKSMGVGQSEDLENLAEGLKTQSRRSAWGATAAGVSALLQGITVLPIWPI